VILQDAPQTWALRRALSTATSVAYHFLRTGVSVHPSKTSVMNTIEDKTTFWSRFSGGKLPVRKMKESEKSYSTLHSIYINDKANWKPESNNFFQPLVPCNVEATVGVGCLSQSIFIDIQYFSFYSPKEPVVNCLRAHGTLDSSLKYDYYLCCVSKKYSGQEEGR
jgi:hypothetical protein